MDSLNVSLPLSLKSFVAQRVADAGLGDVQDYVVALIEADQIEQRNLARVLGDAVHRQQIEKMLDPAVDGPFEPLDMDAIRDEVRARLSSQADS